MIAIIIPDVPHTVQTAEYRRQKIQESVTKEMLELKFKGGFETFQDMNDRMQREAAKIMENVVEEIAGDQDEAVDDNPGMISDSMVALNKDEASRTKAQEKKKQMLADMAKARQQAIAEQRIKNERTTLEKKKRK